MRLEAGTRLGPYEVIAPLGKGGMGEVYRARDTRLGRDVALKVMRPEVAGDPAQRQRFELEARAVSRLNHTNIVAVFDVGEDGGRLFIVSELVEGEPLRALIERGPLRPQQLIGIGVQLAEGLAAAHAASIVHRDLKPENVLLTKSGTAKILDFGLAKQSPIARNASGNVADTVTMMFSPSEAGMILGTVGYMSPEQARGGVIDYRSDQFSLGMMLHEMATGHQVFPRATPVQVLSAILSEEPSPLPAGTPAPLRWIIERCLAKEPDRRYQATEDLAEDLRQAGKHSNELAALPAKSGGKRGIWLVALVIALALGFLMSQAVEPELSRPASGHYSPVATDAGVETSPAFSPDGRSIAYLLNVGRVNQLFSRSLDSPTPVQLTHSSTGSYFPFWSPDGSRIYFTSAVASSRDLLDVGSSGGTPETVLSNLGGHFFLSGAGISRDGKTLAVFRRDPANGVFSIWTSSPPGAPLHRIEPSPFQQTVLGAPATLRFSPDGKKLLFIFGNPSHDRPEFWLIPWPEGSGAARKILASVFPSTPFVSAEWMPDSRHLVMSLEPKLKTGSHIWLADTATGALQPVTGGHGAESDPTVSSDGKRIVYSTLNDDFDLVEIPLDGSAGHALLATRRAEHSVDWSPVHEQYVYVTNRSGTSEIWLHSVSEGTDRPLVTQKDFPGDTVEAFVAPQFSRDGQRIAYGRYGASGTNIWISSVSGSSPTRLLTPGLVKSVPVPTWSPDGNWIAFRSDRPEAPALEKIRVGSSESVVVKTTPLPFSPQWSPDGNWITLQTPDGFAIVSPDGGRMRVLNHRPDLGRGNVYGWSRDGKSIYSVHQEAAGQSVLTKIDVQTGAERRIADLPPDWTLEAGYLWAARLSLSPDGKSVASSIDRRTGDLWMVSGFEPPRSGLQRWLRFGR